MKTTLFTQIYALRAGRVLLLKEEEGPNQGLWNAPGGKVDSGESPYEGALRVLREESGLLANTLFLRGILTYIFQETSDTSIHFIYASNDLSGELSPKDRRGAVSWQHLHRVFDLPMPESDKKYFPSVINLNLPIYQSKLILDSGGKVTEIVEY